MLKLLFCLLISILDDAYSCTSSMHTAGSESAAGSLPSWQLMVLQSGATVVFEACRTSAVRAICRASHVCVYISKPLMCVVSCGCCGQ